MAIPLIDLSDADVVERLAEAYETVGFAQVVGHGIDADLVAAVFEASARFHAQPLEQKLKALLERLR